MLVRADNNSGNYIIRRKKFSNIKHLVEPLVSSGSRIRYVRQLKDLTIKELALLIGVSVNTIGNIERDVVQPSLPNLRKLAEILDRPIYYLGTFEEMPADTLGQKIRKARFYHGLLVTEAAEKFEVDIKSINNWETDRQVPSSKSINEVNNFISITYKDKAPK
ncbi:helix-turn-helix domain-containing protein [Paenibacillus segetis]|uniref:helix-turn-helix domain-containing protein n=1 Tax=Paenibacillus segetis TaxID=1325360 RepID=UPI001662EE63|nr:helix-turn-helix transcriptional regulator [Paenibacillus segetis]